MPTVSVIMGIYNCEKELSNCINSILNQTFKDWELIMCDDGSTDKTYEIAKEFADKYKNIYLLRNNKNMGLAYSLNRCLKIAKGKYVARVDADDICLPERFEIQVDFLENNPNYQVVGSSVIIYDETGEKNVRIATEIPSIDNLIVGVPFMHPTIMMRKDIYDELGGYKVSKVTRRGQDLDLWFRFFEKGYKGYNIQKPLYKYREGLEDYKRRTFKTRCSEVKIRYYGYKRLKLPFYYYIFLIKPLISAIIPNKIMYFYHKRVKGKSIKL